MSVLDDFSKKSIISAVVVLALILGGIIFLAVNNIVNNPDRKAEAGLAGTWAHDSGFVDSIRGSDTITFGGSGSFAIEYADGSKESRRYRVSGGVVQVESDQFYGGRNTWAALHSASGFEIDGDRLVFFDNNGRESKAYTRIG